MHKRLTSKGHKVSWFVLGLIVVRRDEETVVELGQEWILDRSEVLRVDLSEAVFIWIEPEGNQFIVIVAGLRL